VHRKPRRKRRRISRRTVLMLLLFVVFCVSVYMLLRMLIQYGKSRREYAELNAIAVSTVEPNRLSVSETPVLQEPRTEPSDSESISGSLPWEDQEKAAAEAGITVDWDALKKINGYVAAWLYCPDTNISYPVVQYKDNEFFLNRNFNRGEDESGTLFFDYRNILLNDRENWVIYGHRRNDKSMFGSLAKYAKPEYLAEHPVMYLLMPDRNYRVEIFSCRTVHAEQQYFKLWFNDDAEYREYLDKAVKQSYWTPPVVPETDLPILTLATCSTYNGDDEPRLLVHGRLVPIG